MRCCLFCIAVSNVLCSPCISVCFVYCLDKPRHISEGLSWLVSLGQLVWGGCLLRLNKRKKMHKKLTHQKICSVPCSFKWSHEFPRVAASTICVHSVNWCWPETNTLMRVDVRLQSWDHLASWVPRKEENEQVMDLVEVFGSLSR